MPLPEAGRPGAVTAPTPALARPGPIRWPALSLRWRLTLLASGLLALALLLLSLLGGLALRNQSLNSAQRDLSLQYNVLAEAVRANLTGGLTAQVFVNLAESTAVSDARISRPGREPIEFGLHNMPDVVGQLGLFSNDDWIIRVGQVGNITVQVGSPLTLLRQTLRNYVFAFLPLTALIALLGGVLVYFTVGRALGPLTALTARVRDLDHPGEQHPVPGVELDDEVGQLARALDTSLRALEHTRTTERLFLAAASHELRTPVTALRAELEFALARARDAASYRDALRRTLHTTAHLERLAVNLLTLTRLRSVPARQERADLWAVAAEVVDRLMPLALQKGLSLDLTGAPSPVRGDALLLERVVENLTYNAIRYTQAGGVWVHVGGHELTVEDSGPGFPPDLQGRLFETERGFGVGLTLVRQVVEAHGAQLYLEGREGGGARARLVFPETVRVEVQERVAESV